MVKDIVLIDRLLTDYFYEIVSTNNYIQIPLVFFAKWLVYLVPLGLVILWFYKKNYHNLLRATFTGLFGWGIISHLISIFWYRPRPFEESLLGKKELLFHRPSYSFPSDHATFLSGIALSLYFSKEKNLFKYFLIITILISFSRVLIGVHYLSDILAGWIVGLVATLIIKSIDKFMEKYIYDPIIWAYKTIFIK